MISPVGSDTGTSSMPEVIRIAVLAGATLSTDPAAVRRGFEASWVRWNLVRTVSSVAAFGCLIGALLAR